MELGRRNFMGGTALLLSAAGAPGLAKAAGPVSVSPFVETRGGRSSKDAKETRAIAAHSIGVKYTDLDSNTVIKAKHRILDVIGCALGGVGAEGNAALVSAFRGYGGAAEATVIGYPGKMPAAQAAMVNGIIARSYDFEVMTVVVGDRIMGSHISPTTNPTALALCEKAELSGRDYLTALVVGDDVAARILAASGFNFAAGWDGSSVYSVMGAVAVSARLLGLNEQQARDAFGIAVDAISGTTQNNWDGVTTWKMSQGLMARNAIMAAELAKGGWVGIDDALLAPYGFYAQYTGGFDHPDVLTQDLGKAFYGEEYFKPYPSCAATHASHECALNLKSKHGVAASDIASITIRVPTFALKSALTQTFDPGRAPQCSANFSIPYQVANAFLRGPTRQEHYSHAAIFDEKITALIQSVSMATLPAGRGGLEIEIVTSDGRRIVEAHNGTPSRNPSLRPSSYSDIVDKFYQQIAFSRVVSDKKAKEIVKRIESIEDERQISSLTRLLV